MGAPVTIKLRHYFSEGTGLSCPEMPAIAIVDGIRIVIYYNDHDPPHYHAIGPGFRFLVEIAQLRIIARAGSAPAAIERRVLDWAGPRQAELALCWARAHSAQPPGRIA